MPLVNQILDASAAQRKSMFPTELTNAADGFMPYLPLVAQCREGVVKNFVWGCEVPASDLFVDYALLFGF